MRYAELLKEIRKELDIPTPEIRAKQALRCTYKWSLFRDVVDWKDKTVLDIGCCEGYSTAEALEMGAKSALGVDRDFRYIQTAVELQKRIGAENLGFILSPWEQFEANRKFDIVLCLGFIHHILAENYEEQFERVCALSTDTVVMELRVNTNSALELQVWEKRGGGGNKLTKASYGWLRDKFNKLGFGIVHQAFVAKGEREVWVAKRK